MNLMKTTKRRLAAVLLAVMLSVTAFSMPAFAYSQEPITDGTPAETTAPETGTASTDATAGKDSSSSTAALTPKGNLTLVDDVNTTDSSSKQFITLQSKNGNYFYLVIDRSGSKENVYFLNLVDESDLMALIDKDSSSNTVKTCTCTDKCTAGNVNTSCPVCKDDMSKCIGKEKPVETASSQAATSSEPAASSSSSSGKSGSVLMVVALLIVLAAAAVYAVLKFRRNKPKTKGSTDLDDYDYGDEEDQDEEYETDEEPTEQAEEKAEAKDASGDSGDSEK
jgi:hypothetical protein